MGLTEQEACKILCFIWDKSKFPWDDLYLLLQRNLAWASSQVDGAQNLFQNTKAPGH